MLWKCTSARFDGKIHCLTWMKHTNEKRVRIELELFAQRPEMQKGKGDPLNKSQGSEYAPWLSKLLLKFECTYFQSWSQIWTAIYI